MKNVRFGVENITGKIENGYIIFFIIGKIFVQS